MGEFSKDQIIDLLKVSMDSSWRWLSFQAGQRMTLFRYYLVIISVFAATSATLLSQKNYSLLIAIGIIGAIFSYIFKLLDDRIKYLILVGLEALKLDQEIISNITGNNKIIIFNYAVGQKNSVSNILKLFFYVCIVSFLMLSAAAACLIFEKQFLDILKIFSERL